MDGSKYVYNDGDGDTRYDVEYPDPARRPSMGSSIEASEDVQALPFADDVRTAMP